MFMTTGTEGLSCSPRQKCETPPNFHTFLQTDPGIEHVPSWLAVSFANRYTNATDYYYYYYKINGVV